MRRSTSPSSTRAATKFRSFWRPAQSCAAHRSWASRHRPVKTGEPLGAAVLAFWTFTKRPRQPSGSTTVVRSTPSMLKPCCSSNGDHSPASPSMTSARRAVHGPTPARTSSRSVCESRPPSGETSRIWIESTSRPVITRRMTGTSSFVTSACHRSRFVSCGSPRVDGRRCSRFSGAVRRHRGQLSLSRD